jgi:hypothetical protein
MTGRHGEYVDTGTRGDRQRRWEAQGAPSERKWLRAIYISFSCYLLPSLSLYLSRCHLWSALSPNVGRIVCVTTSVRSSVMAARDLHIFLVLSLALSLSLYLSRCHLWSALSPNVGRIVCVTTSVRSSVMAARDLHIFPSRAMSFPLSLSLSIFLSVLSGLLCRPTSVGSSVSQRRSDRLWRISWQMLL